MTRRDAIWFRLAFLKTMIPVLTVTDLEVFTGLCIQILKTSDLSDVDYEILDKLYQKFKVKIQ